MLYLYVRVAAVWEMKGPWRDKTFYCEFLMKCCRPHCIFVLCTCVYIDTNLFSTYLIMIITTESRETRNIFTRNDDLISTSNVILFSWVELKGLLKCISLANREEVDQKLTKLSIGREQGKVWCQILQMICF